MSSQPIQVLLGGPFTTHRPTQNPWSDLHHLSKRLQTITFRGENIPHFISKELTHHKLAHFSFYTWRKRAYTPKTVLSSRIRRKSQIHLTPYIN